MTDDRSNFIGAAVGAAVVKGLAGQLLKVGLDAAVKRAAAKSHVPVQPAEAAAVAVEVARELAKEPAMQNAMNAEPAYQSRVMAGSSMAVIPAVGYCLYAISLYGFDLGKYFSDPTLALALPTAAGAGYAIYGRLRKGLTPLFSRWSRK